MIEYKRISICSCSASLRAPCDGRTWKPMMIASDAEANNTSDSEIWPTDLWMIFTWISSVDNFNKESDNASIEPSTSPFTITFNSLKFPIAKRRPISSRVMCFWVRRPCSRCNCKRLLAISRASTSLSMALNLSPEVGAPCIPKTCTGVLGPAFSTFWPRSLVKAFTLPL